MVTAVLLAAGLSTRFGAPKALATWNGKTVIAYLQNILIASKVDEIIVVLGAHGDDIKSSLLKHKKVKVVYNKDYKFGQTSSFQVGLRAVSDNTRGVLLLPVDYAWVKEQTITLLVEEFLSDSSLILIPVYDDQKGHPPIFPIVLKNEFLALDPQEGANVVARRHQKNTRYLPVNDPGVLMSFNTPEEFERLKKESHL